MAKQKSAPAVVTVAALKDVSIDGVLYPIGSVVELPAALAQAHAEAGEVDPAPAAVAHRVGEGERVQTHGVA